MKILVIASHPNFEESKINKRWVEELKKHKNITVHILEKFYPTGKIDIKKEQELLLSHDRIVFQFPFHWYNITPMLREWQNLVLEYGWAFGPKGNKLKGKEFVVATSIGGPEHSYQAGGYNNYSISELLKPMQQVANLTQMKYLEIFKIHGAVVITDEDLEQSALNYVKHITNPELNPEVALKRILNQMEEEGKEL